jgi:hypothetical protein
MAIEVDVSELFQRVGDTMSIKPTTVAREISARQRIATIRSIMVQFMNYLAISFATSPVATPRTALRRVYWCYLYLRRCAAPVQPAITKALWHAAVTRASPAGVSPTLMKWILHQVEKVEGREIALSLFWKESARQVHAEQVRAWSRLTEEEAQTVHGFLADEDDAAAEDSPSIAELEGEIALQTKVAAFEPVLQSTAQLPAAGSPWWHAADGEEQLQATTTEHEEELQEGQPVKLLNYEPAVNIRRMGSGFKHARIIYHRSSKAA